MPVKAILVGLIGLTLLIYWPVRQAGFVYEDAVYLEPAQRPLGWAQLLAPRGLTLLSFRVQWLHGGSDPRAHHAVNLFLHLLCGLLVYAISVRILSPPAALLASALFLVHPIQSEPVAYLAGGRAELIAAVGILGTVWALSAPHLTWGLLGVAGVSAVVAVGGKELGVLALPLAALYACWFRPWRWSWRVTGGVLLGLFTFGSLLGGVFQARILGNLYLAMTERGVVAYAALQSVALWQYLAMVVWPVWQTVDHDIELATRGLTLLTLTLTLTLVPLLFWARRRWPVISFGIAWLLLSLAPRFIVRQAEYLNEHQVYVAFMGVWIALAASVQSMTRWLTHRYTVEDPCVESVSPS